MASLPRSSPMCANCSAQTGSDNAGQGHLCAARRDPRRGHWSPASRRWCHPLPSPCGEPARDKAVEARSNCRSTGAVPRAVRSRDAMTLILLSGAALILSLGLSFALLQGQRDASTAPQAAPFLGGGSANTHAWQRYHFRAYSMVLVFI